MVNKKKELQNKQFPRGTTLVFKTEKTKISNYLKQASNQPIPIAFSTQSIERILS